jgi:hypothetical protein
VQPVRKDQVAEVALQVLQEQRVPLVQQVLQEAMQHSLARRVARAHWAIQVLVVE